MTRMNPRVCTSRAIYPDRGFEEPFIGSSQRLLHTEGIGLPLPAVKKTTVVLKVEAETGTGHSV